MRSANFSSTSFSIAPCLFRNIVRRWLLGLSCLVMDNALQWSQHLDVSANLTEAPSTESWCPSLRENSHARTHKQCVWKTPCESVCRTLYLLPLMHPSLPAVFSFSSRNNHLFRYSFSWSYSIFSTSTNPQAIRRSTSTLLPGWKVEEILSF